MDERRKVWSAWEAANFAGMRIARALFARSANADVPSADPRRWALETVHVSGLVDGQVAADVDDILEYGIDEAPDRVADVMPLLAESRREALLRVALQRVVEGTLRPARYGRLIASSLTALRMEPFAKKKKLGRDVLVAAVLAAAEDAHRLTSLDPWVAEAIRTFGVKLDAEERELAATMIGEERMKRWFGTNK